MHLGISIECCDTSNLEFSEYNFILLYLSPMVLKSYPWVLTCSSLSGNQIKGVSTGCFYEANAHSATQNSFRTYRPTYGTFINLIIKRRFRSRWVYSHCDFQHLSYKSENRTAQIPVFDVVLQCTYDIKASTIALRSIAISLKLASFCAQ